MSQPAPNDCPHSELSAANKREAKRIEGICYVRLAEYLAAPTEENRQRLARGLRAAERFHRLSEKARDAYRADLFLWKK